MKKAHSSFNNQPEAAQPKQSSMMNMGIFEQFMMNAKQNKQTEKSQNGAEQLEKIEAVAKQLSQINQGDRSLSGNMVRPQFHQPNSFKTNNQSDVARPKLLESSSQVNKGLMNFKSFIQGNNKKSDNILMNLGALDKMANFLDQTLRSNMYRQSSHVSSNSLVKSNTFQLPSLTHHIQKSMMMQSLECYDAGAPSIIKEISRNQGSLLKDSNVSSLLANELPVVRLRKINQKFEKHIDEKYNQIVDMVKAFVQKEPDMLKYKQEGVTFYSRKLLKDFHKFLREYLIESQVPNLRFIGAVSTALRFNEIEIHTWCFGVYLFLVEDRVFFRQLRESLPRNESIILKFNRTEEMVISCAIFAKIQNNLKRSTSIFNQSRLDSDSKRLINALGLNDQLILQMYDQIFKFLDDPIRVHAVWKIIQ